MPKRRYEEKMEKYHAKLRRLEEKEKKRRRRIIDSSSSSSEHNSENELPVPVDEDIPRSLFEEVPPANISEGPEITLGQEASSQEQAQELLALPDLDPEVLSALGETTEETPRFGEKIHDQLARLWLPILRKGINKEDKDKLKKQYLIPENCTLLQAPKLNPEIAAATSDFTKTKDKRVESAQQQLGLAITALNRGLSLLLENDQERVKAIKFLSDSCRLLCDLHFVETDVRRKFMTPGLDKAFLSLIQDVDRDETLFGQKLSDKIKASKAIEKQSLQIKKAAPAKVPVTTPQPTNRQRPQGNWTGPPRHTSNRGGRGGFKKIWPVGRKGPPASTSRQSNQSQNQSKPRAQSQQQQQ